jgi:D-methionine transport system permease protein
MPDTPAGWLPPMLPELAIALGQTLAMLAIGLFAAIVFGGPLGILMFLTGPGQSLDSPRLHRVLGRIVDAVRSFPFVVLLLALAPLARMAAGSSVGPLGAALPLSVAAVPCFAGLVERTLRAVPRGVIEAAQAMGASELQVVLHVLLVEARSGLVLALSVAATGVLSCAVATGAIGDGAGTRGFGGLGALALRYGYYRFETDIMIFTVAILVALVQVIHLTGATLAHRLDKRRV